MKEEVEDEDNSFCSADLNRDGSKMGDGRGGNDGTFCAGTSVGGRGRLEDLGVSFELPMMSRERVIL